MIANLKCRQYMKRWLIFVQKLLKVILLIGRTEIGKPASSVVQLLGLQDHRLDMNKKQDRRLHVRSLCILTAILESLVKFYQEHEDSEKTLKVLEAGQAQAQEKKHIDEKVYQLIE